MTAGRYVATPDERLVRLAERWRPGALVRNLGGGLRGVITVTGDDIAARWNGGSPGHLALMALRKGVGLGGLVHADWEHGDSSWSRVDVLEILDRTGLYRVRHDEPGRAPVCRLAVAGDSEDLLWRVTSVLPPGWRWAARTDPFVIEALRDAGRIGGSR